MSRKVVSRQSNVDSGITNDYRLRTIDLFALSSLLLAAGCSMAPDFEVPPTELPASFREQPAGATVSEIPGHWQPALPLEKEERGQWWKIFGDAQLDDLQQQALAANQSLKAAAARTAQARAIAGAVVPSLLPDLDIGANAVRAKPSDASGVAFGAPPGTSFKPYTLYSAQGVASYEADLFGRVRDNYAAYRRDADAMQAAYMSAMLALTADVAQHYFSLRAIDAERRLMRDTIAIRAEAARIMQRRYELGEAGDQDRARTESELASVEAEMIALDRSRANLEHALAVLVGKMPSSFMLAQSPLDALPPEIPAGLPSSLLARRPDIAQAVAQMAAANYRIGVARTAFLPRILLTASGGFEAGDLSDLFMWSSRSWALGQLAGAAIAMPIFDSGRNLSRLEAADAAYAESVANFRQQVLVAFKDVEDNLSDQRLLAAQSSRLDDAARAAGRTWELSEIRYDAGEVEYFEVVTAQRDALATARAAVQTRGLRFLATVGLIRALGGGWDEHAPLPQPEATPSIGPMLD